MKNFNDLSLLEFTEAMVFVGRVFNGSFEELPYFLDQMNTDCRLAREMMAAMIELTDGGLTSSYRKALAHYQVVLALWILLYEPDILDKSRN